MIGLSGSFAFNNIDLTLQPTDGAWNERNQFGTDGGGHPVYGRTRSFELNFDLISPSDSKQLIDVYNAVGNTGSVVSCLPRWGEAEYKFENYSGTTLSEPKYSKYFEGYATSVSMTIFNIKT